MYQSEKAVLILESIVVPCDSLLIVAILRMFDHFGRESSIFFCYVCDHQEGNKFFAQLCSNTHGDAELQVRSLTDRIVRSVYPDSLSNIAHMDPPHSLLCLC